MRGVYVEVVAEAVELRDCTLSHLEVCEQLDRPGYRTRTGQSWRHPAQIIKLLRSSGGEG